MKIKYLTTYSILVLGLLVSCGKKEEKVENIATIETKTSLQTTQVFGLGRVEPHGKITQLNAEVTGLISDVYVKAGDLLKKNSPILKLSTEVEDAQIEQIIAKIATQKTSVIAEEAKLNSLEVKIANAKLNFDRNSNLLKSGAQTKQVVDDAKATYDALVQDQYAMNMGILQSKKKIQELEADLHYYQSLANRKTIKAPSDGILLSLDVLKGNALSQQVTAIGDFAPAGNLLTVIEIDELFAQKIKIGQAAYVRNQGETDTLALGKVVFVAPYLKKKSLFSDKVGDPEDRRIREVHVELNSDSNILIGSRVEAVIEVGE